MFAGTASKAKVTFDSMQEIDGRARPVVRDAVHTHELKGNKGASRRTSDDDGNGDDKKRNEPIYYTTDGLYN